MMVFFLTFNLIYVFEVGLFKEIYSVNLFLSIGMLNPFLFKVVNDKVGFISGILLFVFHLCYILLLLFILSAFLSFLLLISILKGTTLIPLMLLIVHFFSFFSGWPGKCNQNCNLRQSNLNWNQLISILHKNFFPT